MKNKIDMTIITILVLSFGLWSSPARAGNIDAILDSLDNTSAFVVQDSATSELFRVQGDGKVGIGTTAPASLMHIFQDGGAGDWFPLVLENSNNAAAATNILSLKGTATDASTGDMARIVGGKEQQWTSTATTKDGYFAIQTRLDNVPTEQVRITSIGNVGIGTTGPGATLDIVTPALAGGIPSLKLMNAGTNAPYLQFASGGFIQDTGNGSVRVRGVGAGSLITLETDSVERVFIDSTGNVGIGTTGPTQALDVIGTINASVDVTVGGISVSTGAHTSDQVLTTTLGNFCKGDGSNVTCTDSNTYLTSFSELDPKMQTLTSAEVDQLELIGTTTISANQWATVGGMASTLTGTELNLLDGITVLSGSNTGDQTINTADIADVSVTQTELAELETIGATTISAAQWGFLGAMAGQPLESFSETDPQVGTITSNYLPKWNGSALVTGTVYDNGNVGIGATNPVALLELEKDDPGNSVELHVQNVDSTLSGGDTRLVFIHGQNTKQVGAVIGAKTLAGSAANGYLAFATRTSGSLTEKVRIDKDGNVGIGTTAPTEMLDINSDTIRLRTAKTPATASEACDQGEIVWDANYVYVCVATNTWKRAAIATW